MGPWCKQKAYTFYSGRPLQLAQYHPLPICHECLVVPTYPILLVICMIYSITVSLCLAEETNYSILFYSILTLTPFPHPHAHTWLIHAQDRSLIINRHCRSAWQQRNVLFFSILQCLYRNINHMNSCHYKGLWRTDSLVLHYAPPHSSFTTPKLRHICRAELTTGFPWAGLPSWTA